MGLTSVSHADLSKATRGCSVGASGFVFSFASLNYSGAGVVFSCPVMVLAANLILGFPCRFHSLLRRGGLNTSLWLVFLSLISLAFACHWQRWESSGSQFVSFLFHQYTIPVCVYFPCCCPKRNCCQFLFLKWRVLQLCFINWYDQVLAALFVRTLQCVCAGHRQQHRRKHSYLGPLQSFCVVVYRNQNKIRPMSEPLGTPCLKFFVWLRLPPYWT